MNKDTDQRSRMAATLTEEYCKEHNINRESIPIEISRTIQIQSALGDDFDPQIAEQVLECFRQWDIERSEFWDKHMNDDDLSPEAKDEMREIVRRCWTSVGAILGEDNFKKIYDESVDEAIPLILGLMNLD